MAQVISRKLICPGLSDQILICNEPLSLSLGLASRSAARDSIRFLFFVGVFFSDFSALFGAAANFADRYGAIEAVKWAACEKNICLSLNTHKEKLVKIINKSVTLKPKLPPDG